MSKPVRYIASFLVFAAIASIVFGVWRREGSFFSANMASWAQAIGTVAAVWAAVLSMNNRRDELVAEQLRIARVADTHISEAAAFIASLHGALLDLIGAPVKVPFPEATRRASDIHSKLDHFPHDRCDETSISDHVRDVQIDLEQLARFEESIQRAIEHPSKGPHILSAIARLRDEVIRRRNEVRARIEALRSAIRRP